jgi:hypothetical protein
MTTAYRLWDIQQRSVTGPFCEEKDFLPKVFLPALREVIQKYAIRYDPQNPVPSDDAQADRLWQAGWELFRKVGVYNTSTNRIITLDDGEIKEALYVARGQYLVGAGKDALWFKHRQVEDCAPPFCIFSPDITCDENLHHSICLAYLKEPLLDGICAPILEYTAGQQIRSGAPTEISGCIQHIYNLRLAARQVGRPGVFLVAVGTAEHDTGQIAVSNEGWGVRSSDARLVGSLTEFMTADTLLNRAVHYAQYGSFTGNLTGPIYGGWCGGAEGIAVSLVAYSLSGLCIHGAIFNQHFPFHLHWGSNTTRELLWPIAMAGQAMARNSRLIFTSNGFANAGPMTEMLFYETACHALVSTVSGWNLWEMASARNKYRNRATPLEARMGMEVGHAAARMGMKREQANELALRLLAKYEARAADAPLGATYPECYDTATALPTTAHLDMFKRVKDDIASMGVNFPY